MYEPIGANSAIREEINIYSLTDLPRPEREFDLEALLGQVDGPNGKSKGSFETEAWCHAEDLKRAAAMKAFPWHEWPEFSEDLGDLHEKLEDVATGKFPLMSRASATYMRHLRLRSVGAFLKFVANNSDLPAAWITLSHPDWRFGRNDPYWDEFQFDTPRLFRTFLRIGEVMTAPGFLIAYLHAQFDPTESRYQLQFRGICGGEKLRKFAQLNESLADPRNGPLIRDYIWINPDTDHVRITTHEIRNLPRQMSRMIPNEITARFRMRDKSVQLKRVPEPHHTSYLVWTHLYRMQAIVVMSGVRIREGQLVLVDETLELIDDSKPDFSKIAHGPAYLRDN